jgi:phosphoesterase RecJ-like protein
LATKRNPPETQRIGDAIRRAHRILAITHVAPDGDAIGSLLGLGWLLQPWGKDLTLACEDHVPKIYEWLPGSAEIVTETGGAYDLVLSLDCSDERRLGSVYHSEEMSTLPLINIDHHVTNTLFGTINWVDPSSVATAQMILTLAESLGWALTPTVATCLLTGLVTDTRSFRTSNVDAAAMEAGLRLIEAGAPLNQITHQVLEQRSLASIRLWGQAFGSLNLGDGVLWTEVTRDMRRHWGLDQNGDSGLANFLSGVREANVVVVFTERDDGTIDVGLRAVPGYDVSQVALRLGGGGHPQASGCSMKGELSQVRARVLAEVQHSLAEQEQQKEKPSVTG